MLSRSWRPGCAAERPCRQNSSHLDFSQPAHLLSKRRAKLNMACAGHIKLSLFQVDKLQYFFNFFEPNEQNRLVEGSVNRFLKRILDFTGWDPMSVSARECREVYESFFEILFDKILENGGEEAKSVTLMDWLAVWSHLLVGCMGTYNFPVWLRLLPRTLFRIIDRNQDGLITEDELCNFYQEMVKLPPQEAQANAKLAFAQMTDNGHYPLNLDGYEQIFANFLLGRTPYGPGRHIFGCFEHDLAKASFSLIQPAPPDDDTESKIKILKEKRPKRASLQGNLF